MTAPAFQDERANSGFWAFWSCLPGILTGTAAVVAAVGTLAALFVGGGGAEAPVPGAGVTVEPPSGSRAGERASASGSGAERCFVRYFKGIPGDRVGTVESGTTS